MVGVYAIVIVHGQASEAATASRVASQRGLHLAYERPAVIAFAAAATPTTVGDDGSWIALGRLFARTDIAPPRAPSGSVGALDDLLDTAWGSYVALAVSPSGDRVRVLRDPSGAQPCWSVEGQAIDVVTNDVRLGLAMAGRPTPRIEREWIARSLLYPDLRGPQTPLEGVVEVQPGAARSYSTKQADRQSEPRWLPWRYTDRSERLADGIEAATLLRRQIDDVVRTWCSTVERPLVELSGGLDSSIVAAAVAGGGWPLRTTTLVTPGLDGDERSYAAMVTQALGGTMRETFAAAGMIDLRRSAAQDLPRPASRAFAQAGDRLACESATAFDADCFLSGGGGDNVFAYYASALPAADRLRACGPGLPTMRTIVDAARLTRRTFWRTGRRAIVRAWLDRQLPLWPRDASLLATDAANLTMPAHPWLQPPADALPGKHWHVRLLITIQNHVEGFARGGLPMIFPLLAQPILETALRIPSWLWIERGRDRSVARRAFSDRLPRPILERRTKGGLDSLAEAIIREHRAVLAEQLLDGWLSSSGIIDRRAVELALSGRQPEARLRLLALADVEAWARCWR